MLKKLIFIFLISIFLLSCSSLNKVIVTNDPYKNIQSLKMIQQLYGVSDERAGVSLASYDYIFNTKYIYTIDSLKNSQVQVELKLRTSVRPEILDSVIYLVLDDNPFKLHSDRTDLLNFSQASSTTSFTTENKTNDKGINSKTDGSGNEIIATTSTSVSNSSYQTVQQTFSIPKELYSQLTICNKAKIRAYIGSEGIDIRFNALEEQALRDYFRKVLAMEQS